MEAEERKRTCKEAERRLELAVAEAEVWEVYSDILDQRYDKREHVPLTDEKVGLPRNPNLNAQNLGKPQLPSVMTEVVPTLELTTEPVSATPYSHGLNLISKSTAQPSCSVTYAAAPNPLADACTSRTKKTNAEVDTSVLKRENRSSKLLRNDEIQTSLFPPENPAGRPNKPFDYAGRPAHVLPVSYSFQN